jgi:hypothetical protein
MILPCNPSSVRGYDQFVTSADQLVGQSARRSLVANRPIRPLDIGQPVLISRGQLVAVLYQTDNMALTATGKAMENAGMNQTITVVNGQSNRSDSGGGDMPIWSPFMACNPRVAPITTVNHHRPHSYLTGAAQ